MMRRTTLAFALSILLVAAACQQKQTQTASSESSKPVAAVSAENMTPEELGELGAQIHKTPDKADDLLAQHNLTQESFEKSIRKVTENVDESRRYTAAYKKAGG
jgi:hypothetical protein